MLEPLERGQYEPKTFYGRLEHIYTITFPVGCPGLQIAQQHILLPAFTNVGSEQMTHNLPVSTFTFTRREMILALTSLT
jgi:hypothetical protein